MTVRLLSDDFSDESPTDAFAHTIDRLESVYLFTAWKDFDWPEIRTRLGDPAPIRISGFGITDRTELQVIPYDMMSGGPRVGIEQTLLQKESFTWSIAPLIAEKTSFRQTDLRLSVLMGIENEENRFGFKMTANLRMFQQTQLSMERTRTLSALTARFPPWIWGAL